MNCKPGDLAIRIQDESGDLVPVGAVVRCVRYYSGPANIDNVSRQFTGWLSSTKGTLQTQTDGRGLSLMSIYAPSATLERRHPGRNPGLASAVPSTEKESA